jgi:hypothetical protein
MYERWMPVVGFEGLYEVSDIGRVLSLDRNIVYSDGRICHHRGKVLAPGIGSHGYPSVDLCGVMFTVHSLVAAAFIGPKPMGTEVAHRDGDRTNPRLNNLRYKTPKKNCAEKVRHGTDNRGEKHYAAILTESEVIQIRSRSRAGERECDLMRYFGTSRNCIANIRHNRTWRHVR